MQDATPIALGEEWSGYSGMLSDNLERTEDALKGVYSLYCRFPATGPEDGIPLRLRHSGF
jgi:fumarate hydratase class II